MMTSKVTDKNYLMDGYLQQNLTIAKTVIKRDWDMIFVVDGGEGTGKSVLAQQAAYFCCPKFNIEKIVFTPQGFRKEVINSKPYEALVYDEAYTGLSSRATMSLINRTLISMLAEIRQKNLFIFVVMPSFFDLDKYVALWRSRALLNVYTGKNFQRGFFKFFNSERKKQLYIKGKKFYNYNVEKPNFRGRFTNFYVVDEKEYRNKKKNSLIDREKKREEKEVKQQLENALFERLQEIEEEIPHSLKIKIMNMPSSTYFYKLRQYNQMREFT